MKAKQITLVARVPDDWNTEDVEAALEQAFIFTNHSENDFQPLWVNDMEDVDDFNPLFVNEMEIEPEDCEEI